MTKAKIEIGSTENETPWEVTTERYVAFIDIMGFKNMVERSTHEQIYKMMISIDEDIKHNTSIEWTGIQQNLVK